MWEITDHDIARKELAAHFRSASNQEEKERLIGIIRSKFEASSKIVVNDMRQCGADIKNLDEKPNFYGNTECFVRVVINYLKDKKTPVAIKKYIILSTKDKLFRKYLLDMYLKMYLDYKSWDFDEEIGMFLANAISVMIGRGDIETLSNIMKTDGLKDTRLILLSKFKKLIKETRPDLASELMKQGAGFASLLK